MLLAMRAKERRLPSDTDWPWCCDSYLGSTTVDSVEDRRKKAWRTDSWRSYLAISCNRKGRSESRQTGDTQGGSS